MGKLTKSSWFWRGMIGLLASYVVLVFSYTLYAFWFAGSGMDFTSLLQKVGPLFAIIMFNFKKLLMPDCEAGPMITETMTCCCFHRSTLQLFTKSNNAFLQDLKLAVLKYAHGDT